MSSELFEIALGCGLGPVRFGMSPADVTRLHGESGEVEEWMGGNRNNCLCYPGLLFGFDRCDSSGPTADAKVEFIDLYRHPNAVLFDKAMTAWLRNDLMEELSRRGLASKPMPSGDIQVASMIFEAGFDENEVLEIIGYEAV
ncbi:MAG: hypothetical protein AAF735_06865 [Myxococcota bacterium]